MKKILFILGTLALMATSCKEPDYETVVNDRFADFSQYYQSVMEDESMSQADREACLDKAYDELLADMEEISSKALKKHKNDSVAVYMVQLVESLELTDDEGLMAIIDGLGDDARNDPAIKEIVADKQRQMATAEGTAFVDFAIEQPDGRVAKLSDYAGKGKLCLVDFWASWCGPCKREIPNLKKIYEQYGKKINMVSVAVWDNPSASVDTAAAYGIKWAHIVNAQKVPTDIYGIQGIPHIMLIGPDGTILKRDLRGNAIKEAIEKYL